MREILFRGKRIDTCEWIEGFYLYDGENHYIFTGKLDFHNVTVIGYVPFECFEVDGSTVGQCTSLPDKNGEKIFEGDILKIDKKYYFPSSKHPANTVIVKWSLCSWSCKVINQKQTYYIDFPDTWRRYECEIIGNIHDNLELLTEATK